MTDETAGRVDGVDATVGIVDGRVAMSAQVTDQLRVEHPERTPLSTREVHLTLRVVDDDVRVVLDLDDFTTWLPLPASNQRKPQMQDETRYTGRPPRVRQGNGVNERCHVRRRSPKNIYIPHI